MFSEQMKGITPALPLLRMQPPLPRPAEAAAQRGRGRTAGTSGFVQSACRERWDTLSAQSKREHKGTWL